MVDIRVVGAHRRAKLYPCTTSKYHQQRRRRARLTPKIISPPIMSKSLTTPGRALISNISHPLRSKAQPQCRSLSSFKPQGDTAAATFGRDTRTVLASRKETFRGQGLQQCAYQRGFGTTSSRRAYKTVEEAKSRYRSGPFSWQAGLIFFGSGAGLVFYFRYEKERMERKRVVEATKGVGRPKVGGSFDLVDQEGKPFSEADMRGKYSLVSAT